MSGSELPAISSRSSLRTRRASASGNVVWTSAYRDPYQCPEPRHRERLAAGVRRREPYPCAHAIRLHPGRPRASPSPHPARRPLLHAPCEEVTNFGPELARLVEDLFATMYAAQGVGLAANQVGESLRVFVYDCPDDEEVRHLGHVVNPRMVETDGVVMRGPRAACRCRAWRRERRRYDHAVVEGFTVTGEPITVEGTGWFARCLQHEYDHVEGKVYADRVTGRRHSRLLRQAARASWSRRA
ncbi:peptide deformylase [Streptomyces sp. L7]